jgi:hypothetical protein
MKHISTIILCCITTLLAGCAGQNAPRKPHAAPFSCTRHRPPKPDHDYLGNPEMNGIAYANKNSTHCIRSRDVKLGPALKDDQTPAIGAISVRNYHRAGTPRQVAIINDMMREKAAAMGANAVVHIRHTERRTTGDAVFI